MHLQPWEKYLPRWREGRNEAGARTPLPPAAVQRGFERIFAGLASRLGAARVLVSNVLAYTDEMRDEVLYGYEPRPPFSAGGWPVRADAWGMWGTLDLPRMHWGAEQRCRFVQDRSAVIGWDGSMMPCYALSHTYS